MSDNGKMITNGLELERFILDIVKLVANYNTNMRELVEAIDKNGINTMDSEALSVLIAKVNHEVSEGYTAYEALKLHNATYADIIHDLVYHIISPNDSGPTKSLVRDHLTEDLLGLV
jgi:hypothetical protein